MDLDELTTGAEEALMQFDWDQDDLNDGDQQDTLNTIRSPWRNHRHA